MTPDDVVEAMARGGGVVDAMARAAYASMGFVVPWDSLVPQVKAKWRRAQFDAIRALPPGWVVTEVPGEMVHPMNKNIVGNALGIERAAGHNEALAAVRASAVKVEGE